MCCWYDHEVFIHSFAILVAFLTYSSLHIVNSYLKVHGEQEIEILSPTNCGLHVYTSSSSLTADVEDYDVDDTTNYIVADLINRYTTVDTMVPDIDQYYVTCFEGKVNVVAFKFIQDAVCGYALIIQGIYPISNDFQGKIGSTEKHILQYLKSEYFPVGKISWNDVCPYSSRTSNKVIDQNAIKKLTAIDDVIHDNYSRLDQHLVCVGTDRIPCVYIGGETCQKAFQRACALGIVTDKIRLDEQYDVWRCRIKGKICLVLDGRAHPSAHIIGQSRTSTREFMTTIFLLNAMGRCTFEAAKSGHDDIIPEMFQVCLKIELAELDEEIKMQKEGRSLMTTLLYNDSSGRFPENHRVLRHMEGHKEEVRMQVMEWKTWGPRVLFSILLHGFIYLNPLDYADPVRFWREEFNNDNAIFVKFMSSGIARFLNDAPVTDVLVYMKEEINNDEVFVKALSSGFAKAVSDPNRVIDFLTDADNLLDQAGDDIHQFIQKLRARTTRHKSINDVGPKSSSINNVGPKSSITDDPNGKSILRK